jgi:hypothetical protein
MSVAFLDDNYIRAVTECIGGSLVMLASFIIWAKIADDDWGVDLE